MRVELASGHAHVLVRGEDPALVKLAADRAIKAIHDTFDPPRPADQGERTS